MYVVGIACVRGWNRVCALYVVEVACFDCVRSWDRVLCVVDSMVCLVGVGCVHGRSRVCSLWTPVRTWVMLGLYDAGIKRVRD